jgi:two-component system cell cycle sensor histidine kinase/response regulator CckA
MHATKLDSSPRAPLCRPGPPGVKCPGHVVLSTVTNITPGSPSHTRVLVVDDEPQMCDLVRLILEQAQYRVRTAGSGADAIAMVTLDGPPDLLLTDLQMPQMNGDELAAKLRVASPDLKVLYLTGFSQTLFASRSILWEGEAFLEKPCTPAGLLEAVSLLLFKRVTPTAAAPAGQAAAVRDLLGSLARNPRRDVV